MLISDVSSVDEHHHHHDVLEPTPLLPTQPSVLAKLSAPISTASGSTTTTPATPTKGGATLMSRIGSVKKGDEFRGYWVIGQLPFTFSFFPNLLFHPAAEPQSQETPDHIPHPKTFMSSFARELSTSSSFSLTPNAISLIVGTTESVGNTQHTHTHRFSRTSSFTALLSCVQDHAGVIASVINRGGARVEVGHMKVEIEMVEIPTSGREDHLTLDIPQRR